MPCWVEQSQNKETEMNPISSFIYRSEQETRRNSKFSSRRYSFLSSRTSVTKPAHTSVLIYSPDEDPVPDDTSDGDYFSPSSQRVHLQRELTPVHIYSSRLCFIIFSDTTTIITVIVVIITGAVGTTALFFKSPGSCGGEARYSCTVTPSARETTGARLRYEAARFRARRRFSSGGNSNSWLFRTSGKKKNPLISNARSFRRLTKPSTARYKTKGEGGIAGRARL